MRPLVDVTSKENKHIKRVQKLLESRKLRVQEKQFVTEGVRLCGDALSSGLALLQIFVTDSCMRRENCADLIEEAQEAYRVSDEIARKLSCTQTPQGVFCVFRLEESCFSPNDWSGKTVFLSGLQDPGNIGTIIRTAEAFAVDRLVLSADCPDLYSPKVLRASMGGVFRVKTMISDNLEEQILTCRRNGGKVYAAALNPNSVPITEVDFSQQSAIVIGNEGNGLPDSIIDCCTGPVIIPMRGGAESLNAAAAASIAIWEMCRPVPDNPGAGTAGD